LTLFNLTGDRNRECVLPLVAWVSSWVHSGVTRIWEDKYSHWWSQTRRVVNEDYGKYRWRELATTNNRTLVGGTNSGVTWHYIYIFVFLLLYHHSFQYIYIYIYIYIYKRIAYDGTQSQYNYHESIVSIDNWVVYLANISIYWCCEMPRVLGKNYMRKNPIWTLWHIRGHVIATVVSTPVTDRTTALSVEERPKCVVVNFYDGAHRVFTL